jgi:AraC-like DNA-binding protein
MSLTPDDLAAAGYAVTGRDLAVPSVAHFVRPAPALMSRLLTLYEAVVQIAKSAPYKLARPEVARALEQSLVHAMVRCLTEHRSVEMGSGGCRHLTVIARFEEVLAANADRPIHLAEICAATGVPERTLRVCCHDYLGMGPVRYLWLRRMHLAHRALVLAAPPTTVTEIATSYGFWELGRFSVAHRQLFGETPLVSLRRPPAGRWPSQNRPFSLPSSESA